MADKPDKKPTSPRPAETGKIYENSNRSQKWIEKDGTDKKKKN